MNDESLVYRLRKRAGIRRQISTRKSVQEGEPDRIADLLEEAANEIQRLTGGKTMSEFTTVERLEFYQFRDECDQQYRTFTDGETWERLDEEFKWVPVTQYREERELTEAWYKFWCKDEDMR